MWGCARPSPLAELAEQSVGLWPCSSNLQRPLEEVVIARAVGETVLDVARSSGDRERLVVQQIASVKPRPSQMPPAVYNRQASTSSFADRARDSA
jgi:hypothetical protein